MSDAENYVGPNAPIAIVADMVREAERHSEDGLNDRTDAIQYYLGEMKDTPADEGRSQMVVRLVRAHIKKVMPSICRTILGSDQVVEYQPMNEGDEEGSQQATDYMNHVVFAECGARDAIYDSIHDALLLKNGIVKWWYDERRVVEFSMHTGLTDDAFALLIAEDEVTVVEHTERTETIETDQGFIDVQMHDCRIKRVEWVGEPKVAAVPRDRFLIHPDAVTLDDSLLVGEKTEIRRGDLISMGYDPEIVETLSLAEDDEEDRDERRDHVQDTDETDRANDPIDYYDLYIRTDWDGDGIAELRHMCFAGGLAERNLMVNDECDEIQFADVAVMREPHQWEGISLFDDLKDLQRAETVLLRQTLDNLYWQNNPQPIGQRGAVENEEALINPDFGEPIWVRQGMPVRDAYGFQTVPFVAQQSYSMLEYLDREAENRTGVSDTAAGLRPDALQNMTATASNMIEQASIGQTELMVRTVAEGLGRMFSGLLRLIIRHQDVPRTVRLRDEWVTFDPRQWNASMDATVNTGLGAGTRERDTQMMTAILGLQEKLLTAFGPANNPYVTPENLWNSVSKLAESAGARTPSMYFQQPDLEQIEKRLAAQKDQPDPEILKIQAQSEAKMAEAEMKVEADREMKVADVEVSERREAAQRNADLIVEEKRLATDLEKKAAELENALAINAQNIAFEREKLDRIEAEKEKDRIHQLTMAQLNKPEPAIEGVE